MDRLTADLREELPGTLGWSRSNPFSMGALAAALPEQAIVHSLLDDCRWVTSPCC